MNELRTIKKAMSLFFVIVFLCMGSNDLKGQILNLDDKIDGGRPLSRCLIENSIYDSVIEIENTSSYYVEILDVTMTFYPNNEEYNLPFETVAISAGDTYEYEFNFSYVFPYNFIGSEMNFNANVYGRYFGTSGFVYFNVLIDNDYNLCDPPNNGPSIRLMSDSPSNSIQVSPNPTKGVFGINYSIEEKSDVNVVIYNSLGQKMKTVLDEEQEKGAYSLEEDLSSAEFESGIYYIILQVGDKTLTERIVKI